MLQGKFVFSFYTSAKTSDRQLNSPFQPRQHQLLQRLRQQLRRKRLRARLLSRRRHGNHSRPRTRNLLLRPSASHEHRRPIPPPPSQSKVLSESSPRIRDSRCRSSARSFARGGTPRSPRPLPPRRPTRRRPSGSDLCGKAAISSRRNPTAQLKNGKRCVEHHLP